MSDEPIELDVHRGMSAQKATESRRQIKEVAADQAALRERQQELEAHLATERAATWPELAARLRFLLELFAATSEAQDARRRQLITNTLDDLARLLDKQRS